MRAARPHAPAKTDRGATSPGRAVAAIDPPRSRSIAAHPHRDGHRAPARLARARGGARRHAADRRRGFARGAAAFISPPRSGAADHCARATRRSALWERSEGRATRLIGLTWVETFQAVVALSDAGIAEPAQLAGRRLALPHDASAAIDVHRAAASRGLHAALGARGPVPRRSRARRARRLDRPARRSLCGRARGADERRRRRRLRRGRRRRRGRGAHRRAHRRRPRPPPRPGRARERHDAGSDHGRRRAARRSSRTSSCGCSRC